MFEEYRYDALGRRVLIRAQSDDAFCPGNNCPNYVQRTIWDGNQVLLEVRRPGGVAEPDSVFEQDRGIIDLRVLGWVCDLTIGWCIDPDDTTDPPPEEPCADADQMLIIPPGCVLRRIEGSQDFFPYGVTAYLHGGELDRPLSITRRDLSVENTGDVIQPLANWQGNFVTGVFSNGDAADCMAAPTASSCLDIQWPGERIWNGYQNRDQKLGEFGPTYWMGSLVYSSADASGLLYRRNRYYDPVAGQFTQEDPIGLAGGLSLYGYANGDPVNLSDPFGLCAQADTIQIEVNVICEDDSVEKQDVDAVPVTDDQRAGILAAVNRLIGGTADITPAKVAEVYELLASRNAIYSFARKTADGLWISSGGQATSNSGDPVRISLRADVLANLGHPAAARALGHEGSHLVSRGEALGLSHDVIRAIFWGYR